MKKAVLTMSLIILSVTLIAQSAEVQAKAAFLKAQELYGNADFSEAVKRLESVKTFLGGSNPRVDHLLANSHWRLNNYTESKSALTSYFKSAPDSDPNYNPMLLLLADVDAAITSGVKKASGGQLNYKLEKGMTITIVTETKAKEGQMDYVSKAVNNYTVKAVGDEYTLSNTYESNDLIANSGGITKGILENIGQYAQLFEGKSFDFTMSPSGQVNVSSTSAAMRDKIGMEIDQSKMSKIYKKSFKDTRLDWEFNQQYLAAQLNYTFLHLPETLEKGMTWEMPLVLPSGSMQGTKFVMSMAPAIMELTLIDLNEETVKIGMKYKDEPVLNIHFLEGEMNIERSTGLPISGTINRKAPGNGAEYMTTITRN